MAISAYQPPSTPYEGYALRHGHSLAVSSRGLLTALGDFWTEYLADVDVLKALMAGSVQLLSQEYERVLDMALSSNIIDIPAETPLSYKLFTFDSRNAQYVRDAEGAIAYISYPAPELLGLNFLTSSLFEPPVALHLGEHYEIIGEEFRFYVDIFNDQTILDSAYYAESSDVRYVLMWASNILLQERYLYDRFGRFLYKEGFDSPGYKNILEALQFFFVTTKSVKNLELIINVLYGIPYSRYIGEQVLSISPSSDGLAQVIKTTHTEYRAPFHSTLKVEVGQVLEPYQLMAVWHRVRDYISDPNWYDGARAPYELIHMFKNPFLLERHPNARDLMPIRYDGKKKYNDSASYIGSAHLTMEMRKPVPHYYSGESLHNGTRLYSGSEMEQPYYYLGPEYLYLLQGARARLNGKEYEHFLWELYDKVLKYNLIHIETILDFDTYSLEEARATELYSLIRKGLPSYLYALIEAKFQASIVDTFAEVPDEHAALEISALPEIEEVRLSGAYYYNGEHLYNATIIPIDNMDSLDIQIIPAIA